MTGRWSGGLSGETVCVSDSSGLCKFDVTVTSKKVKKATFTVTGLASENDDYVDTENHDDDGNSDGTSIAIARP